MKKYRFSFFLSSNDWFVSCDPKKKKQNLYFVDRFETRLTTLRLDALEKYNRWAEINGVPRFQRQAVQAEQAVVNTVNRRADIFVPHRSFY